jgi:hypothetical protein
MLNCVKLSSSTTQVFPANWASLKTVTRRTVIRAKP